MSRFGLRPLQDRGAVLVYVAIALLVLVAFSAIVVDYGILWVSRAQAQNAADAGALAGAVSLAWDSDDRTATGPAATKAAATANQNRVWGQPAGVTAAIPDPIDFSGNPNGLPPNWMCPDGSNSCIRVNVYRNLAHGNALPVFFARLFGVSEQGVQAMAIAEASAADTTDCLKPWAVPDKWIENSTPPDLEFDPAVDVYRPPTDENPTGYNPANDAGCLVQFKIGRAEDRMSAGWFFALALEPPCGSSGGGGSAYRASIAACSCSQYSIGERVDISNEPGNMVGPTDQGVRDLVALDPGAHWVGTNSCPDPTGHVEGSSSTNWRNSPRVVPIPLFDPEAYLATDPNGRTDVPIVNLLGFFVLDVVDHGAKGSYVRGYLVQDMGLRRGSGPPLTSFLKVIQLVR